MRVEQPTETFEQVAERFPEADDATRARAAARVRLGVDAVQAMNDETVWRQLTTAYNRPYTR